MKHKLKKILLLYLLSGTLFVSCSLEEEYLKQDNANLKIKIERKTFHELMKEEKFNAAYTKISKQKNPISSSALGRTVMEAEYDFTISNIPAKVITYGNNISYNFHINRNVSNSNYFENLVVKVDSTTIPKAYIIKYVLKSNPIFISEHNAYTLDAQTEITQINYNDTEAKIEYYDGCAVVTLWCPYDGTHPATEKCIKQDRGDLYWVRDTSGCVDDLDSGGGGSSSNPIDMTGGGGGTGGGGTTGEVETPPNDSGNNNPIVTAPVLELEEENEENDPCAKLKSKTNTIQYKQKFRELNKPEKFNLSHESGFCEKNDGTFVDLVPSGDNALIIPSNSINGTHVHQNRLKTYINGTPYDARIKIQSVGDLDNLIQTLQTNNTDPLDAFNVMISNEGIFAISIIEQITWTTELEEKLKKFNEFYNKKCDILIKNFLDTTPSSRKNFLQKMFLIGLKDAGLSDKIALFEGTVTDEVITGVNVYKINWTRKTLESGFLGNTLKSTPCN